MLNSNYYIWIEIAANKHRILDGEYFKRMIDRCVCAGIGSVIVSVKDTTGFVIHKSDIAPHYSRFDCDFKNTDYLQSIIELAHERGLKLFAAVDVFSEGRKKAYNCLSPGFLKPEWQTCMYGIDEKGNSLIKPVSDLSGIRTTGSIDDFGDIFVNPVREDVRKYELAIIGEMVDNYDVDGVVLDRARFIGLGSDFSDYTRGKFEEHIKESVRNWPEDIYKLKAADGNLGVKYGPLFGEWITFRAGIIKDFIIEAGRIVGKASGKIEFIDYTGSWYPLYYLVGANWASSKYISEEYPWVDKEYSATGYAEHLDKLLSGFYYPDVKIKDAVEHGRPAYWYSVEGSGEIVKKVVGDAVPFIGSLFVHQYEGCPDVFRSAVDMCFEKSYGCMLFDLSYIDDYNWWHVCSRD